LFPTGWGSFSPAPNGSTSVSGTSSLAQEDDLPTIYIGQADGVRNRIDAHHQNKDFWDWGIIFVSNSVVSTAPTSLG
jgi:hypothetical protein